jgi:hypothetical protein
MRTLNVVAWLVSLVLLLGSVTPAAAQVGSAPVLYRLESGSSFTRGCHPPCECPLFTTNDIRGTYTLAVDHADPLFTYYRIQNVNWTVTINGADTRITGSGTYKRGGEVGVQQQMTLTLTVGSEAPQGFDSGLVTGGQSFPEIDIAISTGNTACFDTSIGIVSRPVPSSQITPYALNNSEYEEGCLPPCTCPLRQWPVGGTFALVPLPNATTPLRSEWAVVSVNWATISTSPPPDRRFSGSGSYKIVQAGASASQRMVLDLTELNSGTQSRFDSGTVAGGGPFPRIDINLAVNGFHCDDKVFLLHAAPM